MREAGRRVFSIMKEGSVKFLRVGGGCGRWAFCAAVAAGMALPASGKTLVKLTTLAPKDSSYHQALQKMGQQWAKASGGEVDLVIYPGGIQGGESAMIKRMRIGQIQAAMITAVGLSDIEPSVTGLQSMPMMFRDFEEVDFIGSKLQPTLEEMLAAKGFVVLFWTDAGWVQYFSKGPVRVPDDMRKMKMFSWSKGDESDMIVRRAGFNPVALETADILPGLQTGLIDVVAMPPFYALSTQIYTAAKHMVELNWAPLVGAMVIKKDVWEKLSPEAQKGMKEAAFEAGKQIKASSRKESDDAVATMRDKWGLKVYRPNAQEVEAWRTTCEAVYPEIRGKVVPEKIWDDVVGWVREYRAGKK